MNYVMRKPVYAIDEKQIRRSPCSIFLYDLLLRQYIISFVAIRLVKSEKNISFVAIQLVQPASEASRKMATFLKITLYISTSIYPFSLYDARFGHVSDNH